jgi:hypothetical protein
MFLKVLYIVCSPKGNGKCPSNQFLENDEVAFNLAAMSQCEQVGARVTYGTQLMWIRKNLQLVRIRVKLSYAECGGEKKGRTYILRFALWHPSNHTRQNQPLHMYSAKLKHVARCVGDLSPCLGRSVIQISVVQLSSFHPFYYFMFHMFISRYKWHSPLIVKCICLPILKRTVIFPG